MAKFLLLVKTMTQVLMLLQLRVLIAEQSKMVKRYLIIY